MSEQETRPLYEIAREIKATWTDKNGQSQLYPTGTGWAALPYWEAMRSLNGPEDTYGHDDAKSIVLYFLNNARSWRGEDAKRIKAELKKMFGLK